jgi:hypothetical protein
MKKQIFALIITIVSINTYAVTLPSSKEEFCSRFNKDNPSASEILQDMTAEEANLMAFKNDGGLFNGGVCWWHSRFQRNIFYLSIFRPDLNKPKTTGELQSLIHQIRLGNSVVIIPGYHNFADFSLENQKLIQSELNNWQLYDGVVLGGWMDGLKGDTKIEAAVLEAMMKENFDYVNVKKKIAYQKLQIKGITSHAWLIVGMKKSDSGFDIGYLDSNSPRMSLNYTYKNGDTSFNVRGYGDFVPYLEFKREEERLADSAKVYCGLKMRSISNETAMRNEELDLKEAKSIPVQNPRN